jgi:hypothetical protein
VAGVQAEGAPEPVGSERRGVLVRVGGEVGEGHRPLLPRAPGAGDVHEDPEDPGLDRRALLEAVDAGDDGQPGLLDDLLGAGSRPHERRGHPAQGRIVAVEQPGERRLVPCSEPRHELPLIAEVEGRDGHEGAW